MAKMSTIDWIAIVLVIIGAINWGLIGLFGYNLVEALFGATTITKAIYIIVGVSGVYSVMGLMKNK